MINDKFIEEYYAKKYNTVTTSRKDIGDIYIDGVPVNIKSNNVNKNNYSPNLISASKLYKYLSNSNNNLKFLFVSHDENQIFEKSERWIDAEHISWDCLVIQCQGRGVIQLNKSLKVDETQTREKFLNGICQAYQVYIKKQRKKMDDLEKEFTIKR